MDDVVRAGAATPAAVQTVGKKCVRKTANNHHGTAVSFLETYRHHFSVDMAIAYFLFFQFHGRDVD